MIELKPIRVFLAVVDHQSFSAAADAMKLAPASVTRIVAQLEKDLGTQLLVRTTRQVGLTTSGAEVAARFRPIVETFDGVIGDIVQARKPEQGRLRITAPVSFGLQVMPDVLAGFRLAYPRVSLDIQFTDTLVDVIAETCDLAIRVSGPPLDQSTIWRKLCEVPRRAVASPDLLARIGPLKEPGDLSTEYLLSYSATNEAELWELSQAGRKSSRRAGGHVITNNGDLLYALVRQGEGIAVLPDFITQSGLRTGEVVEVMPNWHVPSLWLTLAYPPYTKLPPLVGLFAEYFEGFILDRPDLKST
ncbi:MAG: LysR family transcriptional regulator [Pseudomonadota bacterium]